MKLFGKKTSPKVAAAGVLINFDAAPQVFSPEEFERRVLGNLTAPIPVDDLTVDLYADPNTPIQDVGEGRNIVQNSLDALLEKGYACKIAPGSPDAVLAAANSVLLLHPEKAQNLLDRWNGKWASRVDKEQWYWTPAGYQILTGVPYGQPE